MNYRQSPNIFINMIETTWSYFTTSNKDNWSVWT